MNKISKARFLEVLINNESNRPDKELALDIGITPEHFCRLKAKYSTDIKTVAKKMINKNTATLVGYLLRNAKKGSDNAAKYLLDMQKSVELDVAIQELKQEIQEIKRIQAEQVKSPETDKPEMTVVRKQDACTVI